MVLGAIFVEVWFIATCLTNVDSSVSGVSSKTSIPSEDFKENNHKVFKFSVRTQGDTSALFTYNNSICISYWQDVPSSQCTLSRISSVARTTDNEISKSGVGIKPPAAGLGTRSRKMQVCEFNISRCI